MFLNRLSEITKPTVHAKTVDLGMGDGPETIYFRDLTFQERQDIFGARAKEDGSGLELRGEGRYLGAELIAASLCTEDGEPVVRAVAVRKWKDSLVDKIAGIAMEILTPENKADDENPSTAQS